MLKGHRAIESITLDREVVALKDDLMPRYARMIYNGYWFSPERQLMQTLIDESHNARQRQSAAEALQRHDPGHRASQIAINSLFAIAGNLDVRRGLRRAATTGKVTSAALPLTAFDAFGLNRCKRERRASQTPRSCGNDLASVVAALLRPTGRR